MIALRSSFVACRQGSDCPGCGRDLNGLDRAIYCPDCGRQIRCKNQWERMVSTARFIAGNLVHGRFGHPWRQTSDAPSANEPTPILIGYGNAMFKLGWRYERGGGGSRNLPEALRCYRKSARLGNVDATIRLAAGEHSTVPAPVVVIRE
jgi:TPR repeat protein